MDQAKKEFLAMMLGKALSLPRCFSIMANEKISDGHTSPMI